MVRFQLGKERGGWIRSATISFRRMGKGCGKNLPGRTLPQGQSVILTTSKIYRKRSGDTRV